MQNKGYLIISLDFELNWGSIDRHPLTSERKKYYENTRKVIPEILNLFKKYKIHATWATVGFLFNSNRTELENSLPTRKPEYSQISLSPYEYINNMQVGESEIEDPYHFGKSIINKIMQTLNQEIGSHTFSHFYCNEPGQTIEDFRMDMESARKVAELNGLKITSLVFPRNQYNSKYLQICKELNITAIRANPDVWWWRINSTRKESLAKRFFRGLDAYIPLGRYSYPISKIKADHIPIKIPASRLLRPYRKREHFLNRLKIKRIKSEMSYAAARGEVYHLWWHPHNFGLETNQNLADLEDILAHYRKLSQEFKFTSISMGNLADKIIRKEVA